jgi:hypothetical protein
LIGREQMRRGQKRTGEKRIDSCKGKEEHFIIIVDQHLVDESSHTGQYDQHNLGEFNN